MHLLKYIIAGAAVGYGVYFITKKDSNGHSIIEDLADNAPHWFEQGKKMAEDAINSVSKTVNARTSA
jgi:hypothetical protein